MAKEKCSECNGTGETSCNLEYGEDKHPESCPMCGGDGRVRVYCPDCDGTGKVEEY